MAWAGNHTVAYAEFVELALRLELLCRCEGFARVRDALKRDPREEQIPHLRLQLEVGALAARAGYGVRFERPVPDSSKTSDVTIDLNESQSLLVEARVILQDDRAVAINRFTEQAFPGIQNICSQYEVECSGDLIEVLGQLELAELLNNVETHARLVKAGGVTPRLVLHGATLQVSRRGTALDRGLHGPALTGDLWPRIADRLDQKARQTEGAQNVWLRICALQGLWLFTEWASLPLADKLVTMRQNILSQLSDHPHVDGVVISSASAWPQGTIEPDEYEDGLGGYVLRCAIPPIMARETLIVPLHTDSDTRSYARVWRDLYASEPDWLDYALARFALPSTSEIFATAE
ncbi:MAG TPA: hypothetical protein VGW98_10250 [Solirubrobacteraceae bacterium]|jgi:hypothetical protein|nr:hypothetical protein [Solirubrobacteraceae bacterium]